MNPSINSSVDTCPLIKHKHLHSTSEDVQTHWRFKTKAGSSGWMRQIHLFFMGPLNVGSNWAGSPVGKDKNRNECIDPPTGLLDQSESMIPTHITNFTDLWRHTAEASYYNNQKVPCLWFSTRSSYYYSYYIIFLVVSIQFIYKDYICDLISICMKINFKKNLVALGSFSYENTQYSFSGLFIY